MSYSTFSTSSHDATREPMFFGRGVNVARYDKQKYPIFEKLIEKQLSFFWRQRRLTSVLTVKTLKRYQSMSSISS